MLEGLSDSVVFMAGCGVKAGVAHFTCYWEAGKTVWFLVNISHTWAHYRWASCI